MRLKNNKYIFIILSLLVVFATYLQYTIEKSTHELQQLEVKKAKQYAEKISKYICEKTNGEFLNTLRGNPEKVKELESILHTFLTDEFKYIFIVRKDQKGNYRFLLDGSREDSVEFNSLFFPLSDEFDKIYALQYTKIIEQKDTVEGVWRSLVYPIVKEGETKALMVMDLSKEYVSYLSKLNTPITDIVRLMQGFLVVSFIFLGYLTYTYYRFRKKVLEDEITGAKSKLFLEEFFNRQPSIESYTMLMLDIDEFKRINRLVGFDRANDILREFVKYLKEIAPQKSFVVRLVGTEFALIFPNVEDFEDLEDMVAKLHRKIIEKSYLVQGEKLSFTVSMSVMVIPEKTMLPGQVLRVLDEKLVEVKSRGKNNYILLNKYQVDAMRYSDMEFIQRALEEGRLTCLYQPIYHTQTKKIAKYEALVRLIDDKEPEKLISPFYFLPTIKGTTQYIKMSKMVLENLFEVLVYDQEIEVSMNLDLTDLFNQDMMKLIHEQLSMHKELAHRVTFEIVEDIEIKDFEKVREIFKSLKSFGSKIALDDFGSGYANYGYLINLDWDIIKIDGSLIKELLINPARAEPIIRSINELSIYFQCEVVAEFVSDQEIYESVKNLCVEFSQGYYLGEPKPITAYIEKPKQNTSDSNI